MKKFIVAGLMILVLFGCSQKLDESFNEEELYRAATSVVENLNEREYDLITQTVSTELQNALSPDVLKSAWIPLSEKLGVYQGIEQSKIVANKDGSATIVILAGYEKGKMQLTVTYDQDMKLIGLYVK